MSDRVIWLQAAAPVKPLPGQACNGCGVCCAAEPCPVARLYLWQNRGACRALHWSEQQQRYFCGLVLQPKVYLKFLPNYLVPWFSAYVASRIAANTACDSQTEAS